jgi:hypothetical protein
MVVTTIDFVRKLRMTETTCRFQWSSQDERIILTFSDADEFERIHWSRVDLVSIVYDKDDVASWDVMYVEVVNETSKTVFLNAQRTENTSTDLIIDRENEQVSLGFIP